jgi:hypothetical protein
LPVLARRPSLKRIIAVDDDAPERPFQNLDLEAAKAGGLASRHAIAESLRYCVLGHPGKGTGEGRAAGGACLLPHAVCQPSPDERLYLTA